MKLSIAQLLAIATGVRAHGYLSQPMSRTGLNAQVRVRKLAGDSFLDLVLRYYRRVPIHALNVPSSSQ
jgi:hypothetical protein